MKLYKVTYKYDDETAKQDACGVYLIRGGLDG